MSEHATLDFETRSPADLPAVGAAIYAAHPETRLLSLSYDVGAGLLRWRPGMPDPEPLFAWVRAGGVLEAWNVAFERWVWERLCVPRMGWPAVAPHQWTCAMARARAYSLPGRLALAGNVLRCKVQKDADGDRLLKKFSMPRRHTKSDKRDWCDTLPDQAAVDAEWARNWRPGMTRAEERALAARIVADYEDTQRLYNYNDTDVLAEQEISARVPALPPDEAAWWRAHEDINRRGVAIDREGVANAIAVMEQAHERYHGELFDLTGIDAATKVAQLARWLADRGVQTDSLDEDAVNALLKRDNLTPDVRRVLEIRARVGSASVKKLYALRDRCDADGRLRDLYVYYGAHTGRSTGEGPQPTNLPRAGPNVLKCHACERHHRVDAGACPWCGAAVLPRPPSGPDKRIREWSYQAAEDALELMRRRSLDALEAVFGDGMLTIAGCLRGMFVAAPGHDLISTDLNSIEAVGLAMLSGEKWRIEVFRTHGKIYEASAAQSFNAPLQELLDYPKQNDGKHHPLRQKGKIGELAFGYQGWLGAAQAFGMPGTEQEIKDAILAWRDASPSVVWLWGGQTLGAAARIRPDVQASRWDETPYYFGVEGAAVSALMAPGTTVPVVRLDGTHTGLTMRFDAALDTLSIALLSGRNLTYHRPRMEESDRGGVALSFERWNTNPKYGAVGWTRQRTWGGRLVENINQAVCADVFRHLCLNLEAANYPIVLHTYDEPVSEVPEGWGNVAEYERICAIRPPWASDWPIKAPGGYRAKRYRKG